MTDDDLLELRRKDLEESVKCFGSDRKSQREMWVVRQFLGNLGLSIPDNGLTPGADPPDVLFGNAKFEVKEIMDPGRRRHAEYKNALAKARKATKAQELLEPYTPRDATLTEISEVIRDKAENWAKHYDRKLCVSLDLLCYVNLRDVMGLTENSLSRRDRFARPTVEIGLTCDGLARVRVCRARGCSRVSQVRGRQS